jgi:hypothetical protein
MFRPAWLCCILCHGLEKVRMFRKNVFDMKNIVVVVYNWLLKRFSPHEELSEISYMYLGLVFLSDFKHA